MAYIKQIWDTTSYINPTRMNHIEDGIAEALPSNVAMVVGAKNFNSFPYYETSKSGSGITWTVNDDGTIKATGQASAQVTFTCHFRSPSSNNPLFVENGNYIVSGCASGGAANKYRLAVGRTVNGSNESYGDDVGDGLEITINGDDFSNDGVYIRIVCVIANGYDCGDDGLIFKPMLRVSGDNDDSFVPYAMTNKQITDVVGNLPTTAGTYSLQCVVDANGNRTFSWV